MTIFLRICTELKFFSFIMPTQSKSTTEEAFSYEGKKILKILYATYIDLSRQIRKNAPNSDLKKS